jgi:hypothetical protein
MVLLYVLTISPALRGRSLLEVLLPAPHLASETADALVATLVLAFWWQLARSRPGNSTILVCENCNLVKLNDGQTKCRCGGDCFDLDEMIWVENPLDCSLRHQPAAGTPARLTLRTLPHNLLVATWHSGSARRAGH